MSRLGIRWSGSIRISTSSSLIPLNRSRFFLRFASSGDSPYCCCDAWCWADMALWLLLWLQLHNTTVNWRMNAIKLFTMHIQLANSRSAIRTADFAPVYNSLHHNVKGLRLAASATAHSLARTTYLCGYTVRLAGCSSVTSAPLHMAQHVQYMMSSNIHKKLSYRGGTVRCVVSIEILPIATQQCRNYLYDKSWPNRWYEVGDLVGGNAW